MAVNTERGRPSVLDRAEGGGFARRLTTETKHALKTTEYAMVAVIVGILIASAVVGQGDGTASADPGCVPGESGVVVHRNRCGLLHGQPWAGEGRQPRAPRGKQGRPAWWP
jgi:hypothetical protein